MSGGLINVPIVFRGPANGGTNVGATHSHTPENFAANTPGVKVICPATPADAKGMLKSAIRDNDPVCVMENTILYNLKGEVPDDEYLVPLGKANVVREGTDLSIIAHGKSVHTFLQVAQTLEEKHRVSAEVVDLRSIRPLDTETTLALSAKQTECCWSKKTNRFAAWTLKLPFLFKIRLSITLTLPSRGFPPSTLRKLTARHSKTQIPNHDRVLARLRNSFKFSFFLSWLLSSRCPN